MMNADRRIFLLALCFICVSSNVLSSREEEPDTDNSCEQNLDVCETQNVSAALGSSVLLPCIFTTASQDWVSWDHSPEPDLVQLKSDGHVKFLKHRFGRVKAFPNQGSEGNYSICIDELQHSDLGCYRCKHGDDCVQVRLVAERDAPSEEMKLAIYIFVGVAALILLTTAGYCCVSSILNCDNKTQDYVNNPEGTGGVSAPVEETGRAPGDQQQRGGHSDDLVYENDDQDPSNQPDDATRNYCSPVEEVVSDSNRTQPTQSSSGIYPNLNQSERTESLRTKQRFHRELFNRLRQASLSRHYYANQGEISKQQAMSAQAENHRRGLGKKKNKENGEYKNPIYNRSTDQLNRL